MINTWGWAETFNYSGESWCNDEYLEMVDEYLDTWIFEVRWKHLIILEKAEAMTNTKKCLLQWWILDIWRWCLINLEKVEAMMNT